VVALRPDQLEVFNSLRVIEGRVAVAAKFGNPLFGVRGLGRLQNFFDLLFANLRVNDVKDPVLAHEFLVVFHGDVDGINYAKPNLILDVVEDFSSYTIWKARRRSQPGTGYSCTLLHGSESWFGAKFLLLDTQITLPEIADQAGVAALITLFDDAGSSLQLASAAGTINIPTSELSVAAGAPSSSTSDVPALRTTALGASAVAPTISSPHPAPSAPTSARIAELENELREARSLAHGDSGGDGSRLVGSASSQQPLLLSLAQIEQMRQLFGPQHAVSAPVPCVVAPTINVPPVQSDAKRKDLAAVLAVVHVFSTEKFDKTWLVTGLDVHGNPSAYNVVYAEEVMREILEDLHGQYSVEPSEAFLNASLLLCGIGAKGLFLEDFLVPAGKITTWGSFGGAFFNMWRAYSNFCGDVLGAALIDLKNRVEEIQAKYPQVAIKTIYSLSDREASGPLAQAPIIGTSARCSHGDCD
jgi:hypothetical protein